MLALLLAAVTTCSPPSSPDLVGFWETRATSLGGIGGALELRADGSAVSLVTVIVGFTYEIDGDRLLVRWENDPPAETAEAVPIRFEGDTFVQAAADGTELRRTRLGSATPGMPAIVGDWRYSHYTGSRAFERYGADGTMQLRIPMRGTRGCYTIEKDRLTIELDRQKPKRRRFVTEGDELELRSSKDQEPEILVRVPGGAWYLEETNLPGLE